MLRKCLLLAACTSLSGRLAPPLSLRGGQYGDSGGPGGSGPPQPWDQPPRQQWQPGPGGPQQQQPPYGQPPPYGRPQGQQPQGYPAQGRPQYPPQGQPGQPQQYAGAPQPQHMQQRPPQGQQAYGQQPGMPGPPGQYGAPPAFVPTFHDLVRIPARYGPGGRPMLDPATLPRLDKKQAAALRQPKRADALALSFSAAADTAELQRSLGMPLGCLVQPLAADAFLISNPRAEEDAAAAAAAAQGGWRAPPPPPLVCRCQTCNGYLNPFATIWPQAAKWECNLCGHVNDLPPPAMPPPQQQPQQQGASLFGGLWGARGGPEPSAAAPPPLGRPETVHADVEYVLSGEEAGVYSTANDGRPRVLVLALETTRAAAASGALRAACVAAKEALAELAAADAAGRAPPRVALVTFDATARVHRLSEGSAPAVELMLPTAVGLPALPRAAPPPLYDVRERLAELSELLDRLPQQAEAAGAAEEGAALGAAVEIARSLASEYSGDLVLLSVSGASAGHARGGRELPVPAAAAGAAQQAKAEAKGPADAAALERLVRAENAPLRDLARACADAQLAVRLVVAPRAPKPPTAVAASAPGYPAWGAAPAAGPPPPPFVDVASLAQLPRISGGRLLYVAPVSGGGAAEHLAAAMKEAMNVTHAATDAVLRLRTSKGLQQAGLRLLAGIGTDADDSILLLPSLDKHATYAAELRHADEKKPLPPQPVFVQAALLFTAPSGERRIRVSTRRLAVVDNLRAAAQALVPPVALVLRAKLALAAAEKKPFAAVRDEIKAALLESVVAQRELCPPPLRKTSDELILFRALALLPLLLTALSSHALLNTPTLSAAATRSPDAVAAQAHALRALPTNLACLLLLPRVITVHERALGDSWVPGDAAAKPAEPPADEGGAEPADASGASGGAVAPPSAPVEELGEVLLPRAAEVSASSVLLVDSLDELTLWVGAQAAPSFLERLFGAARPADGAALLGAGSNGDVDRMHALIASLRAKRPAHAPLRVVVQGSPASDERLLGRLYASAYEPFLFQLIQDQRARL